MSVQLNTSNTPLHPDPDAAILLRSMPDLVRQPGKELSPMAIVVAYLHRVPLEKLNAYKVPLQPVNIQPTAATPKPLLTVMIPPPPPPLAATTASPAVSQITSKLAQATLDPKKEAS